MTAPTQKASHPNISDTEVSANSYGKDMAREASNGRTAATMTGNRDPRDMTLAELGSELDEPTNETPIASMQSAYVDRMDTLTGLASDFIAETLKNLTFEHFDEITREAINRDEFPEAEIRLIHSMITNATVTIPEPSHIERLRKETGRTK